MLWAVCGSHQFIWSDCGFNLGPVAVNHWFVAYVPNLRVLSSQVIELVEYAAIGVVNPETSKLKLKEDTCSFAKLISERIP